MTSARIHPRRTTLPPVSDRQPLPIVPVAFYGRVATDDTPDHIRLQRQYDAVETALPPTARIVVAYVDTGDAAARSRRGPGPAVQVRLPVPVHGGLSDLLAESADPDRGFDAVVPATLDRLSRRPSEAVRIEATLLDAGVLLLTANDPAIARLGAGPPHTSQVAARRVTNRFRLRAWDEIAAASQAASRDTLQGLLDSGWHVGPAPYGYRLDTVATCRPKGRPRHRLVPDPPRARVVKAIFAWRHIEALPIATIRRRLAADPNDYPPPNPRAGHPAAWSVSAVRGILLNPLYTGYRVRDRRDRHGRPTDPTRWRWPDIPAHEPLITLDTFRAVNPGATPSRPTPGLRP